MTVPDQAWRIQEHTKGEVPPPVRLALRFAAPTGSEQILQRAREVMRAVADAQTARWWNDDEWKRILPAWFLATFEGHSDADLVANPDLWDFGSWLDAMKDPGWEWWSTQQTAHGGTVRAAAHSDPYSIEPLAYLLRASGATDVEIEEE
jgi:hypothetical protein